MLLDLDALPQRGDLPAALPIPPSKMALRAGGQTRKRWRYIGLWGEDAMLCAARVQVGVARQRFWALWDGERLRGRTSMLPIGVEVDGAATAEPFLLEWHEDGEPLQVVSRHGDSYIWTRKVPLRATGVIEGKVVEMRGLIDDSAGYHARDTKWRWCAGVGDAPDGTPLAWNFCEGLHDAPEHSERAVWVGGELTEPGPTTIAYDLRSTTGPAGETLRAEHVATRAHKTNYGFVASDYEQPFANFSGMLPGGVEVARGWGVLERHSARW